jgi:hypothetical protein
VEDELVGEGEVVEDEVIGEGDVWRATERWRGWDQELVGEEGWNRVVGFRLLPFSPCGSEEEDVSWEDRYGSRAGDCCAQSGGSHTDISLFKNAGWETFSWAVRSRYLFFRGAGVSYWW